MAVSDQFADRFGSKTDAIFVIFDFFDGAYAHGEVPFIESDPLSISALYDWRES